MPKIEATVSDWTEEKDGKKIPHKGGKISADFNFGTDLKSMTAIFGENIVYKQALGALTVAAQGGLRSQFKQGKAAGVAEWAKTWKPGERKQGKSPREKLMEQLASMTPEERAAILKEAASPKPAAPAVAARSGKKAA